mmetsp:Transcript_33605/g.104720  ORF Transcript_33605/g.104720 Transcript_33605/m.104720 type:complete len:353 (+) Transcript_33605:19-1077(+)
MFFTTMVAITATGSVPLSEPRGFRSLGGKSPNSFASLGMKRLGGLASGSQSPPDFSFRASPVNGRRAPVLAEPAEEVFRCFALSGELAERLLAELRAVGVLRWLLIFLGVLAEWLLRSSLWTGTCGVSLEKSASGSTCCGVVFSVELSIWPESGRFTSTSSLDEMTTETFSLPAPGSSLGKACAKCSSSSLRRSSSCSWACMAATSRSWSSKLRFLASKPTRAFSSSATSARSSSSCCRSAARRDWLSFAAASWRSFKSCPAMTSRFSISVQSAEAFLALSRAVALLWESRLHSSVVRSVIRFCSSSWAALRSSSAAIRAASCSRRSSSTAEIFTCSSSFARLTSCRRPRAY